jgi:2-dehydro-3-deoxyphosphogluconate aldolase / (4S)-4-hydroxy-2-oxoglutarate aldolase
MLETLKREKIVAIVRGVDEAAADRTAQALAEGGIRLLEVTMNTEGALAMMTRWRERYGGRLRIGAGTVLDLTIARQAVAAGAEFLISPNVDEEVVKYGAGQGIEVWPGALTPTEIMHAWQAGASAVKVFPAGTFGPAYLKDVRAPLGHIPLIAVGGIDVKNAADFLRAGAIAVGVGGNLVSKKLIQSGQFAELAALARQYVDVVNEVSASESSAGGGPPS